MLFVDETLDERTKKRFWWVGNANPTFGNLDPVKTTFPQNFFVNERSITSSSPPFYPKVLTKSFVGQVLVQSYKQLRMQIVSKQQNSYSPSCLDLKLSNLNNKS